MTFKRAKYQNKKVPHPHIPGHWFDSMLERALFFILEQEEKAGLIKDLKHHPGTVFLTSARVQYRPDFSFVNCHTKLPEWSEAKGMETSAWRIKRKLWLAEGPGRLFIYKGSHKYLKLVEILVPKEKK